MELDKQQEQLVKILSQYNAMYPTLVWDEFKSQVARNARFYNPHRRYGVLWFHIPSVISAMKEVDFEQFAWMNTHNPMWKRFMQTCTVTIDHRKTMNVRGIKELEFNTWLEAYVAKQMKEVEGNESTEMAVGKD